MGKITKKDVEDHIIMNTSVTTKSSLVVKHMFQLEYKNFSSEAQISGIGDFFRGSYALWQMCRALNITLELDFHNHPVGKYFVSRNKNLNINPKTVRLYLEVDRPTLIRLLINNYKNKEIHVMTHIFPVGNDPMPGEFKMFMRHYLQPTVELYRLYRDKISYLGDNYRVVHIRGGDPVGSKNITDTLMEKVRSVIEESVLSESLNTPIVVISDNLTLRDKVAEAYNWKTLEVNEICHLANANLTTSGIEGTLIDLMLMTQAQSVYSLSVYWWNTGFSEWITKIYDVPLKQLRIQLDPIPSIPSIPSIS